MREGAFPDEDHSYGMKAEEQDRLGQLLQEARRTEPIS